MIWKILLTLAVIVGALFYVRQRSQSSAYNQLRVINPDQVPTAAKRRRTLGILATSIVLVGVMALYYLFRDDRLLLQVEIINTQDQRTTTVFAYEDGINKRDITTIDGKRIQLADSDRVEIREIKP